MSMDGPIVDLSRLSDIEHKILLHCIERYETFTSGLGGVMARSEVGDTQLLLDAIEVSRAGLIAAVVSGQIPVEA